ncbi:MAG: hypothetical protein ABJB74_05580 [Gemmatimonas sp.]
MSNSRLLARLALPLVVSAVAGDAPFEPTRPEQPAATHDLFFESFVSGPVLPQSLSRDQPTVRRVRLAVGIDPTASLDERDIGDAERNFNDGVSVLKSDGLSVIYVINRDGTERKRLTTDPFRRIIFDHLRAWSPDGAHIAVYRGILNLTFEIVS